MHSVVVNSFHYIRIGEKNEAMYDLASDPEELTDLLKPPQVFKGLEPFRRLISGAKSPR
jgi:hypothetical protein